MKLWKQPVSGPPSYRPRQINEWQNCTPEQGQPKKANDIGNITDRMGAFSTDIAITQGEQKKTRLMKQAKKPK